MNNVSRREVLAAAGGLTGALAIGASSKWSGAQPSSWTVVAIPDTQKYAEDEALISYAQDQTNWIASNLEEENIAFVSHEGDLVENGAVLAEWQRMDRVMGTLDGVVPYSTLLGNHDYAVTSDRSSSIENYRDFFGASRYQGYGWFGGAAPEDRGYYQRFSAGGYDFLHLALEWGVPGTDTDSSTTMGWAQDVLDAHPDIPTIVTTHSYLWDEPGRKGRTTFVGKYGEDDDGNANSGQDIFRKLVRLNPQVFMVLNGHYHQISGEWAQVSENDAGLAVYEMLANYQHYPNGGDGWLRTIEFVPAGGLMGRDRIEVRTYSPSLNEFRTDDRSQFDFDLSFDDRFSNTLTR